MRTLYDYRTPPSDGLGLMRIAVVAIVTFAVVFGVYSCTAPARAAAPTTAPAGYALAGGEWATVDYGPHVVDVAYGVPPALLYRSAVSGRVTFSNAFFGGDPIVGVSKRGYWRPAVPVSTPSVKPATTTRAAATQPVRRTIELAIVDGNGTPAAHAKYLAATGMVGVREWIGINWHTGRANDMAAINRCNAWAAAGYSVVATASPDEVGNAAKPGRIDRMCPDFSVAALDLIKLDGRVIIQVGNESNTNNYGIGGSFASTCRTFSFPILRRIRALDPTRQLASASIVYQTPEYYAQQWAPLIAEATGLVDYVDVHDYTLDSKNFDAVLAAGGGVAAQLNAKLMCSEWGGFFGTGPATGEKLAVVLAAERASIRARTDVSAYFVAQRVDKFGDDYAWLWDRSTGRTTAAYAVMAATSQPATTQPTTQPVSLLDQLRANTAVIDARNRAVAPVAFGCIAGVSDDQGWQNMSVAGYGAWTTRDASPVWIVDDETPLDAAGIATVNARVPTYLAMGRAAGKLVGAYGPAGNRYWPYVNADDPKWQSARDATLATDDALMPIWRASDLIVVGGYPQYGETPDATDATELAAFVASDRTYLAGNVAEGRRLSSLTGKPFAVQVRACDTTSRPMSAARADAFVDALAGVNVILWGDVTPDGGIADQMLARLVAQRSVR